MAPALAELRLEANVRWPTRAKVSDGWIADAAHVAAGTSDHIPDASGLVRAIDLTNWDPDGPIDLDFSDDVAQVVAEHLRTVKDPRTKYVIWRGRMFSSYVSRGVPAWTWRPYSGPNGHFHHVHVSVVADDRALSTASWGLVTIGPHGWRPGLKNSPDDIDLLEDLVARMTDGEKDELMEAVRCFNRTFNKQQKSRADGKTDMWLADVFWWGDANLKRAADALVKLAGAAR